MPPLLTRIAPTPSGYLHSGNALNFLITQKLAEIEGAGILLRIDDIDDERLRAEYLNDVFSVMRELGIDWQLGPTGSYDFKRNWSQQRRAHLYDALLQGLVDAQAVYACGCSRKELSGHSLCDENHRCRQGQLPLHAPDVAWRLRIPMDTVVRFRDGIMGDLAVNLTEQIPDPVVRRRDGRAAYQVASLADDVHFGIGLIVRGEDLLASTAVQLYMAKVLHMESFAQVRFFHHQLIRADDGQKLSKSAGTSSGPTQFDRLALQRAVNRILHLDQND
jgi:glutamyl/glutaminyl-tRNA synthetase